MLRSLTNASFSPVVFVSLLATQQGTHKNSKLMMMMMMLLHMFLKSGLITKIPVGAVCWIQAVKSSLQTAGVDWTHVCVLLQDYCVESH